MSDPVVELTEDAFLGGQLQVRQFKSGHRSGHDAVLLAAATAVHPGDRVVDLGAGAGVAGERGWGHGEGIVGDWGVEIAGMGDVGVDWVGSLGGC